VLEAVLMRMLSALLAMAGRFDQAREHVDRSSTVLDELSNVTSSIVNRDAAATTRELIGDITGAERDLRSMWTSLRDPEGRPEHNSMRAAYRLGLLYCDEGRWNDAERCLDYGRDFPEPSHPTLEKALGFAGRARLAAHRGDSAEALTLARRAVEVAEPMDMLNIRARAWLALAEVHRARSKSDAAAAALAEALHLYEAKGNVAAAARLRDVAPA
jgi:tetratricopeptide (TPR) repeat protein